jgi:1-acyl-sn-glycerol-3-phosphate acyltransferase
MLEFDAATGERGLVDAARQTERLHARDVRVYDAERLPSGSFLALSNHPGLTDTLALFVALGRDDLRAIALRRPFLAALEHVSKHLFFLPDAATERVAMIRGAARHLRAGGALVTFPAGHTEPDPDVYPGALESLRTWLESSPIFVLLAPGTPIVPVCVRGVAWAMAARHPLARLRRTRDDQQLLASALQLLSQVLLKVRPVTVKVQVGQPILLDGRAGRRSGVLHQAIVSAMRSLIQNPPVGPWQSAFATSAA